MGKESEVREYPEMQGKESEVREYPEMQETYEQNRALGTSR